MGDRVYALQFHLEVTPWMIDDWCCQEDNCGDVRELTTPIDAQWNSSRMNELAWRQIFGAWCDMLSQYGEGMFWSVAPNGVSRSENGNG